MNEALSTPELPEARNEVQWTGGSARCRPSACRMPSRSQSSPKKAYQIVQDPHTRPNPKYLMPIILPQQ